MQNCSALVPFVPLCAKQSLYSRAASIAGSEAEVSPPKDRPVQYRQQVSPLHQNATLDAKSYTFVASFCTQSPSFLPFVQSISALFPPYLQVLETIGKYGNFEKTGLRVCPISVRFKNRNSFVVNILQQKRSLGCDFCRKIRFTNIQGCPDGENPIPSLKNCVFIPNLLLGTIVASITY